MKNKISDLNNHLFSQLERLGEEELKGDELKEEIGRAKAISGIASQIIQSGNLALNAHKTMIDEGGSQPGALPDFLEPKTK